MAAGVRGTMTMLEEQEQLKAVVQRYRVCFEVWPLREIHQGRLSVVGFEIDLVGTPAGDEQALERREREYAALYDGLRMLARATIPRQTGPTRVDILPFDHCIHASSARDFRDDVELHMHVAHYPASGLPIDEGERACLHEIVYGLS